MIMEMNLIAYALIALVALFGIHEIVSAAFYIWLGLSARAAQKLATKIVETSFFKSMYYLDDEDEEVK